MDDKDNRATETFIVIVLCLVILTLVFEKREVSIKSTPAAKPEEPAR